MQNCVQIFKRVHTLILSIYFSFCENPNLYTHKNCFSENKTLFFVIRWQKTFYNAKIVIYFQKASPIRVHICNILFNLLENFQPKNSLQSAT